MTNRRQAGLAIIIMAVLLAACGIRTEGSVTSGEMAVPEVSSEDLLISSLQYLLLNDEEEESSNQETEVQDDLNAAGESEEASGEQPERTEDNMQGEAAVIYYGDGGSAALRQETIEVGTAAPEELINALAGHNILSLDTKVNSFEQQEEEGAVILYLDLSKAVSEYLRTMSREAECIIVSAIANTFLENYGADAIYITVEGRALSTFNAEYAEPIRPCTPEELLEILGASDADSMQSKLPLTEKKE